MTQGERIAVLETIITEMRDDIADVKDMSKRSVDALENGLISALEMTSRKLQEHLDHCAEEEAARYVLLETGEKVLRERRTKPEPEPEPKKRWWKELSPVKKVVFVSAIGTTLVAYSLQISAFFTWLATFFENLPK